MSYLMCRSPSATVIDECECVSVVHGTNYKKCKHTQDSHGYEQIFFFLTMISSNLGILRVSKKNTLFLELPKLMKYMNIFK